MPRKLIDPNKAIQHRRLGELNKLIRDSWQTSEQLADKTREIGSQAVAERVLCGHYLNEMKAIVGHGYWTAWLRKHRPEVSPISAQRAMTLAKASHVMDLSEAASIRQAYIICGILPAGDSTNAGSEQKQPTYDLAVDRFSRWRSDFDKTPLNQWPEKAVERLKNELQPIVKALWPEATMGGTSPQ